MFKKKCKINKKIACVIAAIIIVVVFGYIVKAKKETKINTAPQTGVSVTHSKNSKYVDIIYTTDKTDPVYLAAVKQKFIQMEKDYKANGKDLLVNGVKPENLDLTKIGDKNGPPMQVPINK
jgi:FlaG/FlaF family flagellin (archaellin)